MASARRTAPGEPLNTADVVRSISAQPDNYAAACATLALAADVDARTVGQALNERDYSSNKPRARVARAIDSLGWDRLALEALASGQVARKG